MEVNEGLNEEVTEERHEEQKMINLQRDLMTSLTDIQTAADAKEALRRTELEEARRIRLERQEKSADFCQQLLEDFDSLWSTARLQEATPDEQEVLKHHAAVMEEKKKLVRDLQQKYKETEDRFVKELREQKEERELMEKMIKEQRRILEETYREELDKMEKMFEEEFKVTLSKDKTEWDQDVKVVDKRLEMLTERREKALEASTAKINSLILESYTNYRNYDATRGVKTEVLKLLKSEEDVTERKFSIAKKKRSVQKKVTGRAADASGQRKLKQMSEEYKRAVQKNELLEKQIKHFAVADAKKFQDVWLVSEKQVKEQVERVLDLDSLICRRVLGLSWERPPMEFTERSGPVRPQGQSVSRLSHSEPESECSQRTMDICVRAQTDAERTDGDAAQRQRHRRHGNGRDASEDRDFWERMSNIISEDKLKLWDDTEDALKQYHCVLTDVSALAALTETLQRENAELRRQLEALQDKRPL